MSTYENLNLTLQQMRHEPVVFGDAVDALLSEVRPLLSNEALTLLEDLGVPAYGFRTAHPGAVWNGLLELTAEQVELDPNAAGLRALGRRFFRSTVALQLGQAGRLACRVMGPYRTFRRICRSLHQPTNFIVMDVCDNGAAQLQLSTRLRSRFDGIAGLQVEPPEFTAGVLEQALELCGVNGEARVLSVRDCGREAEFS